MSLRSLGSRAFLAALVVAWCLAACGGESERSDIDGGGADGASDGALRDGCACWPGSVFIETACGAPSTLCAGVQKKMCTAACMPGPWGPCEAPQPPAAAETCANGIDDNCDGQVDEGCP